MSFTSLYDSLLAIPCSLMISAPTQDVDDDTALAMNIAKVTASHEEAMVLEEIEYSSSSSSTTEDDETSSEEAVEASTTIINTTTKQGEKNNASYWKQLPKPVTVEGVELSCTTTLTATINDDKNKSNDKTLTLYRNGYGVRTVRAPFGYNLHVYVATLYTQRRVRCEQDVQDLLQLLQQQEPEEGTNKNDVGGFVMEFTFLRDVSPSQMSIAWNYQLDTSVTDNDYESYQEDRTKFLKLLDGSMKQGGIMRFEFHSDRMILFNQEQKAGEINGNNFSKAFVSMWFGDQPVMEEIKDGLLKGDATADIVVDEKEEKQDAMQEQEQKEEVETLKV